VAAATVDPLIALADALDADHAYDLPAPAPAPAAAPATETAHVPGELFVDFCDLYEDAA